MANQETGERLTTQEAQPLFAALDDPAEAVRVAALRALVRLPLTGDDWARLGDRIGRILQETAAAPSERRDERREVIEAAAYVPLGRVRHLLHEGLRTWTAEERFLAAQVLAIARDPTAVAPLTEALATAEIPRQTEAAEHLCYLDVTAFRGRIAPALHVVEDAELRFWLALALAKSGDDTRLLETALTEISRTADDFPPFWGDPERFLRRVEATGPIPQGLATRLRVFAARGGLDARIRDLAERLADTAIQAETPTPSVQPDWQIVREMAGQIATSLVANLPPESVLAEADLNLPQAPDWTRANGLVGGFLELLADLAEPDPMAVTLAGNAIAAYAAALGRAYRADVPELFRAYVRTGQSDDGLPAQLAWMASRAGIPQVLEALREPLMSSTDIRLRACRFVEAVVRSAHLSGRPVFGDGTGPGDIALPSGDDFLDTLPGSEKGKDRSETPAGAAPTVLTESAPEHGIVQGAWERLRTLGRFLGGVVRLPQRPGTKAEPPERDGEEPLTKSIEPPAPEPKETPVPEPVLLAVSGPREASPGGEFIAQFAAYVEAAREEVRRIFVETGGDTAKPILDVRTCRWQFDTPVTVRVSGRHFTVEPPEQSFQWNGTRNLLDFFVTVDAAAAPGSAVLRFEVYIAGLRVELIGTTLEIKTQAEQTERSTTSLQPGRTAFASYASVDREEVAHRLSTLQAYDVGLDIFMDCLDLVQGEDYKRTLKDEIAASDRFFLFWSAAASHSPWVEWEWHRRKEARGIDAITPSPLENPEIVPPPKELGEHLNFRDAFMIAAEAARSLRERKSRQEE